MHLLPRLLPRQLYNNELGIWYPDIAYAEMLWDGWAKAFFRSFIGKNHVQLVSKKCLWRARDIEKWIFSVKAIPTQSICGQWVEKRDQRVSADQGQAPKIRQNGYLAPSQRRKSNPWRSWWSPSPQKLRSNLASFFQTPARNIRKSRISVDPRYPSPFPPWNTYWQALWCQKWIDHSRPGIDLWTICDCDLITVKDTTRRCRGK